MVQKKIKVPNGLPHGKNKEVKPNGLKGGPGAAVEPTVCNRKVPGSSSSLCTFVWVRLGA